MTLRVLSGLTLLAGVLMLAAVLVVLGDGSPFAEARHLRLMKQRTTRPEHVEPITPAGFLALPHAAPLAQRARIESRGVSIEGWNQRLMLAQDGDVHLEITAAPRRPDSRDTAYVTAEITPAWRSGHPGWSYEALDALFRPNGGGTTAWDAGPRRVRVTGWLLYDYQYDKRVNPDTLGRFSTRLSGWEVHPVTRIEAWDDARAAWVEVPR